eukprot:362209-Chlamydomonas_euryale.AAC.6
MGDCRQALGAGGSGVGSWRAGGGAAVAAMVRMRWACVSRVPVLLGEASREQYALCVAAALRMRCVCLCSGGEGKTRQVLQRCCAALRVPVSVEAGGRQNSFVVAAWC